jgi:peptidyl-prolyl cis-trans isomerase SurA
MALSIQAADLRNRVVAYVNDEIITAYEMNTKMQELTGNDPEDLKRKNEDKYEQLCQEVLNYLIEEKLAQIKVRELGIMITEKQVEAVIESRNKDLGWTREYMLGELKKQGLTYDKYAVNVKKELELSRMIESEVRSKIIIKEEKIKQYYQDHLDEFKVEDQVHLADIFLVRADPESEEDARKLKQTLEEIKKKIAQNTDFGELAKVYSQSPGAESGGELGSFKLSQLDPELQKVLEGLSESKVGGPLIRPNGVQFIQLIKREKGNVKSFGEAHNAIYNILYQEEVKTRYNAWIKGLRESSYVKIVI